MGYAALSMRLITMVKSGLLDYATAYADGRLTFTFKNGQTIDG
jgi:hypothetical protein